MNFSPQKNVLVLSNRPAAVVRVTGEDAASFLQGQFTNNLNHPAGSGSYGLWLNQKGKVLADSDILRISDREFLIVSIASAATVILPRLEQYIIADDVLLEDQTLETSALTVWGEGAGKILEDAFGSTPQPGQFTVGQGVFVFKGRSIHAESFQLVGEHAVISDLLAKWVGQGGARQANDSEAQYVRIKAGIPSIPADIGPTDLPQEAGLEDTAISFTKGCYLGQEVMARLKNLGQVRRALRKVRGVGGVPPHGTPLFQGAKKAGEMRSAVATPEGFIGLAMLTRLGLDESAGFSLEGESDTQKVTVWMS